jgi:predicted AAA+ superfamily ATPase
MVKSLVPRYIVPVLKTALRDTPVVCLLGPRQVGKTTLAHEYCPEYRYINFDDNSLLDTAKRDPVGFVQSLPDYVILDEVQRAPEILPAIKMAVDQQRLSQQNQVGRFLLTGSANLLLLTGVQESLAGRVEIVDLYPLTEQEKHRQPKSLLSRLLNSDIKTQIIGQQSAVTGVAEALCKGGYPESAMRSAIRARQWHRQYLNAIIQRDVKDIAAIRDEQELARLMEILAYRTSTLMNTSGLANELKIARATIEKYLIILERLFLVRRLPAWHRNQAKRLIKTAKVHVIDSGLAATLSRLKVEDWHDPNNNFGPLLESFVVQQLICQASWLEDDFRFSHYRDKDQIEVDLVIEQGKQLWGIEVKKAVSIQAKDGAGLSRLANYAGKSFQGGILFYCGNNTLPLKQKHCYAVPVNALWHE